MINYDQPLISGYKESGFELTDLVKENESIEYDACTFKLNKKIVIYRKAKITPTKIGQFVTIWKRDKDGITAPFDISDSFDFFIITVKTPQHLGQFIFPKALLAEKGIISGNGKSGKRGIRVYPAWDIAVNKQAIQTQKWQLRYFMDLTAKEIDLELAQQLLNLSFRA